MSGSDHISESIIPLDEWIEWFVRDWLVPNFREVFQVLEWPIQQVLEASNAALQWMPPIAFLIVAVVLAWRTAGWGVALFTAVTVFCFDAFNVWEQAMTTLALIITAVAFCAVVGVPVGIIAARSDRFATFIRPILDIMQTIPAFVYLVPIVMLFGIGLVPGIIATIIFALPPIIRLTNLGIRQVQEELVEAGYAFGATPRQILWDIQVPLALRTIMAGLNQTLMLAISMVVIAALIGAEGLGSTVYRGVTKVNVGEAAIGGIGIVLMAIVLDRITQAMGESQMERTPPWTWVGVWRAILRLPSDFGEAMRGSRERILYLVKVIGGVAIAVGLVIYSFSGGEPSAAEMRQAWAAFDQAADDDESEDEDYVYAFDEKRACQRTSFLEQGYLCSFLGIAELEERDRRRILRARFAYRDGAWTVLGVE